MTNRACLRRTDLVLPDRFVLFVRDLLFFWFFFWRHADDEHASPTSLSQLTRQNTKQNTKSAIKARSKKTPSTKLDANKSVRSSSKGKASAERAKSASKRSVKKKKEPRPTSSKSSRTAKGKGTPASMLWHRLGLRCLVYCATQAVWVNMSPPWARMVFFGICLT